MVKPIVLYSHSQTVLNKKSVSIKLDEIDKNIISSLITDIKDTLSSVGGLGLAANQIGRDESVCVINIDGNLITMINPEIISNSNEKNISSEGCLSIPDVYAKVQRYERVTVKFINPDFSWKEDEMSFDFPNSVIVQHEIDHLNGKLMIDEYSPMQKNLIQTKLKRVSRGNVDINYVGMTWRESQKSWSLVGPLHKLSEFYAQFQQKDQNLAVEQNKTE